MNSDSLPQPTIRKDPPAWFNEAYDQWLDATSIKHPEQRNRQQTRSTLNNNERALRLLSYGAGFGGNLTSTPASLLQLPPEEIGKHVERGSALEAIEKGKPPISKEAVRNMKSYARAVARGHSLVSDGNFISGHHLINQRQAKKRRSPMPYARWSATLRLELEECQKWLSKPTLRNEQKKYRPNPLKSTSTMSLRRQFGPLIKWRVESDKSSEHLIDLISEDELTDFFDDYLAVNENEETSLGGYAHACQTAVLLAGVLRYLVATEQYDPFTGQPTPSTAFQLQHRSLIEREARFEACERLRKSLYKQGRDILKEGKRSGKHVKKAAAPKWTPLDLRQIRDVAFHTPALRTGAQGTLAPTVRTTFTRKRSATMFGISSETPLRIRTLTLLRWDHLIKLSDGRWRIEAPGSILKVEFRNDEPNSYNHTYSAEVSGYIDEYYAFLVSRYGPNFESSVPNVFPLLPGRGKRTGAMPNCEQALARGMIQLAAELRNERFSPHDSRYIVATHCIRTLGAAGIMLAARLLGDTPETILKHYVEELGDDSPELKAYFKSLKG